MTRLDKIGKGTIESRWAKLKAQATDTPGCSWDWAPSELLADAIVSVTGDGAALLLSKTSDGGALSLTILDGTHRLKWYPASEPELRDILEMLRTDTIS